MSALGLNIATGRALGGIDHLRQSVRDILMTPIGSRVMRRDYGSNLFELVDRNVNPLTLALVYAATIDALRKWEPRLRVTRVQAEALPKGADANWISLTLEGLYLPEGREITLEGLIL
jgi:Bacteriophage baseplate protein W